MIGRIMKACCRYSRKTITNRTMQATQKRISPHAHQSAALSTCEASWPSFLRLWSSTKLQHRHEVTPAQASGRQGQRALVHNVYKILYASPSSLREGGGDDFIPLRPFRNLIGNFGRNLYVKYWTLSERRQRLAHLAFQLSGRELRFTLASLFSVAVLVAGSGPLRPSWQIGLMGRVYDL